MFLLEMTGDLRMPKITMRKRAQGGGGLTMRVCFWNIRGLGGKGRRRQLREMIFKQRIDVIYLQETMKTHFSLANLRNLIGGEGTEFLLEFDLCKGAF
jgi:hypothetical protein